MYACIYSYSLFIQCEQSQLESQHNFVNIQQFEQAEKGGFLGTCIYSMQVQTQFYCSSYLNTTCMCSICIPIVGKRSFCADKYRMLKQTVLFICLFVPRSDTVG